jgi:hypothetical protein
MPPLIQWVFLLFGAWLIYLNVQSLLEKRKALKQAQEAATWPSVTGRIVTAQIVEGRYHDSKSGNTINTYRPEVTYNYNAGGAERVGSRLAFGKILYYQPTEAEAFMSAHGQGAEVQVFHDPAAPQESVLDRNPAHATKLVIADTFMLIVGLALFGTGLGAMLT